MGTGKIAAQYIAQVALLHSRLQREGVQRRPRPVHLHTEGTGQPVQPRPLLPRDGARLEEIVYLLQL